MAINRTRATIVLLMVDTMFVALHLLSRVATWRGDPIVKRHEFIDLDAEVSLPPWWQQSQLLAAAALCALLVSGTRRRHWVGLATIFVYLSADEGSQFHESLIHPMQQAFVIDGGVLTFAWVIPGAVAVVAFAVAYARFWPARPRLLMGVAGACFVAGAVGGEMLSGQYETTRGLDRGYDAVIAIEEGLEMLGASLFIASLLFLLHLRQERTGTAQVLVRA